MGSSLQEDMSAPAASPGRPSNSLHFIVGEMSGKLDQVLATLLTDRAETGRRFNVVDTRFDDVDTRLKVLEGWRWKLVGGGSIVVLLLGSAEAWRYVAGK